MRTLRLTLVALGAALLPGAAAATAAAPSRQVELEPDTFSPAVFVVVDVARQTLDGYIMFLDCTAPASGRDLTGKGGSWYLDSGQRRLRARIRPDGTFRVRHQVRLSTVTGDVRGPAVVEMRGHIRRTPGRATAFGTVRVISRNPCDAGWHAFRAAGSTLPAAASDDI